MQTIWKGGMERHTVMDFFKFEAIFPLTSDVEVFSITTFPLRMEGSVTLCCWGQDLGSNYIFALIHSQLAWKQRSLSRRPLLQGHEAQRKSVCHEGAPLISCFQDKSTNTPGQNVLSSGAWVAWLWKELVILIWLHSNKRTLECQKSDRFTQRFLKQSFNFFFFFNRYLITKACKAANIESRLLWCRSHYKVTEAKNKRFRIPGDHS